MVKEEIKSVYYGIFVLLVLSLIAFLGYYYGFLGVVYKVIMPQAFSRINIVLLSMLFGVAAFFSPCAFTVMPAYISHHLQGPRVGSKRGRLALGLLAALGVMSVTLIIGAVIAILGAAAPFSKDPREDVPIILAVRIIAGLVIASLGVMTLMGRSFHFPLLHNFLGDSKRFRSSMFWYGVFYNSAALGCTGPILLGLILYAFASGSFNLSLLAFVVFSLTMGLLMLIFTLLISKFRSAVSEKLMPALPIIKRIATVVMIVVGLGIAILTLEGNRIFVDIFFPFLK